MHIRKYDFDYGRRKLMEKAAMGVGSVGALGSVWPMIAKADTPDISKAYPEELTSIEANTKGKIKPGDTINADNVEHVKHLLDEVELHQIQNDGREIQIGEGTSNMEDLFEAPYLEATLKYGGQAKFGDDGNLWHKGEKGVPAKGGMAFPEPKTALEAQANINYAWGRHNYSQYAIPDWDIGPSGNIEYQYEFVWSELQVTARPDGKVWDERNDKLRYQSVFFTDPNEQAGTSFLSIWYYDQRRFPDLIGYLPAFKRVREYPTNQRFEPLVPGITVFLSAAWSAGDPMLTWGEYEIVGREPMLGDHVGGWSRDKDNPNWGPGVHGGPKGNTYWNVGMQLVPECIVIDTKPVKYPRSPVGRRRTWLDARNGAPVRHIDYDNKDKPWKGWHFGLSKYPGMKTGLGHEPWSWHWVESHDIQANRMSRFYQAKEVSGGYQSAWDTDNDDAYNKYLTSQAMRRLGA